MASKYPRIFLWLTAITVVFAVVGGFAGVVQLASTSEWRVWLIGGAVAIALTAAVYLVIPFLRPTPPNPANPTLPTPVNRVEAFTAVAAAVSLLGASMILGWQLQPDRAADATEGTSIHVEPVLTLDQPAPESSVPQLVTMSGTAANLGTGETVWMFSSKLSDPSIYLHSGPCPIDASGRWTCRDWSVGDQVDPVGIPYRVVAVRANSATTERFLQIYREIDQARTDEERNSKFAALSFRDLPQGVVSTEPVTVYRR